MGMKALKYRVTIHGSMMDYAHGAAHTIDEIYIPGPGLCVNLGGKAKKELYVFKEKGPRIDPADSTTEIDLPEELYQNIMAVHTLREQTIDDLKGSAFSDEE